MAKTNKASFSQVDLNKANVRKAIADGKNLLKEGKTKAEATREIFPLIKDESRELICHIFQKGAGLTEKGSMTYYYNCRRKLTK
jgi:hypothetical protein